MSKKASNFPPAAFRFIHFRDVQLLSGLLGDQRIVHPNGGITLAFVDDVVGDKPVVRCGLAYCHTNDKYNKKLGRIKAAGRLMQNIAHNGNLEGTVYIGGEKYMSSNPGDDKGAYLRQVIDYIEQEQGYYRVRPEA